MNWKECMANVMRVTHSVPNCVDNYEYKDYNDYYFYD